MWHEIYICNSETDRRAAEIVCHAIEKEGIRCWFTSRDLLPGLERGEATMEAIASAKSSWSYCQDQNAG